MAISVLSVAVVAPRIPRTGITLLLMAGKISEVSQTSEI
jgi:hypothetical protein